MTKTHGKLNHVYITGSCTHGHNYLGSIKEKSQSLGNIGSSRPNLIYKLIFWALLPPALIEFICNRKQYEKKIDERHFFILFFFLPPTPTFKFIFP